MSGGPGLTGGRNFENSCEVYWKGDGHRTVVYGLTRDEVVVRLAARLDEFNPNWRDVVVVTATKRLAMGFSPARTQVTRGSHEYY